MPASLRTRRCLEVWYWGTLIRSERLFTLSPDSRRASMIRRRVESASALRTSEHSEPCITARLAEGVPLRNPSLSETESHLVIEPGLKYAHFCICAESQSSPALA